MNIDELRKDLKIVDNKFTETSTIATLANKYGVKQAGRVKMSAQVAENIVKTIRKLKERDE